MNYKALASRLFHYLHNHKFKIIITVIAVILSGISNSLAPEITGRIIDNLFGDVRYKSEAIFYASALLAVGALGALFTLIYTASNTWVANKVIMDIRADMFNKILQLPQQYFDNKNSGEVLSKITFDVTKLASATTTIWLDIFRSFVMVVVLVGYLFYKNYQLSLMLLILMPIIYLTIKIAAKRMHKASDNVQQTMGEITHNLNENISANHIIKIYNAEQQKKDTFHKLSNNLRQQLFKLNITEAFNTGFIGLTIVIILSIVVYSSSIYLNMTSGEFLAFFTAMGILAKPVKTISQVNKLLQEALVGANSVFGLIDSPAEINNGKLKLTNIKSAIIFNNVSFGYDDKLILKNINLNIKVGQTIAFVGATGSGKSTIVKLLCRFYNPTVGSISIDGVDINNIDINNLRTHIALVDQNIQLFSDTIVNNISLGGGNISYDVVKNAAKNASATEFIDKLANKFSQQVGENGTKLSGGQRQRLAIARAITKNSNILIFDEATSALDSNTEANIQQAISSITKNKTVLIIAHRLSTIKKADKIIVLEQGKIVEQGTHQELLANNSYYQVLYNKQSSK